MQNSTLKLTLGILCLFVFIPATQVFSRELGEPSGYSSDESGGAYLGVDTRNVTTDRLGDLKLKEEQGVEVTMVDQDAPAGKAGLKEHDVILTLNGTQVESVEQLRRMIREIPPGRIVTLGISRDGQAMTIKAQLADRKALMVPESKHYKFVMPAMPAMPATPAIPAIPAMPAFPDIDVPVSIVVVHSSLRSGLMVENLTPQLGDFFGAKNGQGVLVRSVEKGSSAEKAGFRAGDVIVKVNGETVSDTGDFSHALHGRKNNTVSVGIIRERKEQTITLTLPERKQSRLYESYQVPDLDSIAQIDLSQLKAEMARLEPELEQAARQMSDTQIQQARAAAEEAAREFRAHGDEWRKEMEEVQRQFREQERELHRELENQPHPRHADI
ncbi:MAG TPA: PDZ domain-containing protein [Terriglobales bacterium]|nr:PDZ domain-containing protein [Terriglobales bacterium]